MRARVVLGIWLLADVGCSDDDDASGGGSMDGDGAGTAEVGTDDGLDADATTPMQDSAGGGASDGSGGAGLDEIVGEWVGKDPIAPMQADHMTVRADGTATAELYWIMEEGGLWGVQLQAIVTVIDDDPAHGEWSFSFTCDEVGDCTQYEFDTMCSMFSLGLVCIAPEWYGEPEIVFERPE
jgi:hypothetical protein